MIDGETWPLIFTKSSTLDTKSCYSLIRQVFGPPTSSITPLKAKDNANTIKGPEEILQQWEENFTDLFDNPSSVNYIIEPVTE